MDCRGFLLAMEEEEEEEEEKKAREHVPMSVRIFPLLDMMQKAAKKKQNVMWGVP